MSELGMLWYDDDPKRQLADRIARAVAHYRTKYNAAPSVCFCHPSQHVAGAGLAAGVRVEKDKTVMQNHLWVCQE